jgi:hypothetical protein
VEAAAAPSRWVVVRKLGQRSVKNRKALNAKYNLEIENSKSFV